MIFVPRLAFFGPLLALVSAPLAAQCPNESFRILSTSTTTEWFGDEIAINGAGDVFLAAAPLDTPAGGFSGSVYVRQFDGTAWADFNFFPATIQPDDGFGKRIALDAAGDTALVSDEHFVGQFVGDVYVFQFDGTAWLEQQKLPNPGLDFYGSGLAINDAGDVAFIGSAGPNKGGEGGEAFLFRFDGTSWSQDHQFQNPGPQGSSFGNWAFLDGAGDTAVINGWVFEFDGTGWAQTSQIPGGYVTDLDGSGTRVIASGRIYHFDGSLWIEEALLPEGYGGTLNAFGDVALVLDYDGTAGVGRVHRYERDGSTWSLTDMLLPEHPTDRAFGRRLALNDSGSVMAISANRVGPGKWPVYIQSCSSPNAFCEGANCPCGNDAFAQGCDNGAESGGVLLREHSFLPDLSGSGSVVLVASGFLSGGSPAALAVRSTSISPPTVFGDGLLCLGSPVRRLRGGLAQAGALSLAIQHGAGMGTFHYQLWYRSTEGHCPPGQFNLSNGISLTW
jgi:hypothetical protein